jgi:hypothetical protein
MRCEIQRNQGGVDQYGQEVIDWQTIATDVPCTAYHDSGAESIRDIGIVSTDQVTVIVPLSTNVDEHDLIKGITDRQGNELFDLLVIEAVMKRRDHIQIRTRHHD